MCQTYWTLFNSYGCDRHRYAITDGRFARDRPNIPGIICHYAGTYSTQHIVTLSERRPEIIAGSLFVLRHFQHWTWSWVVHDRIQFNNWTKDGERMESTSSWFFGSFWSTECSRVSGLGGNQRFIESGLVLCDLFEQFARSIAKLADQTARRRAGLLCRRSHGASHGFFPSIEWPSQRTQLVDWSN